MEYLKDVNEFYIIGKYIYFKIYKEKRKYKYKYKYGKGILRKDNLIMKVITININEYYKNHPKLECKERNISNKNNIISDEEKNNYIESLLNGLHS